jgi:hypothetical protein
VKNRFHSVPFKCNLQRYTAVLAFPGEPTKGGACTGACTSPAGSLEGHMVGLYKLNPVDHP